MTLKQKKTISVYFSLIKKPLPPWVLFVSSKQKAWPGKDMSLIGVFSPILCSLKPAIGKFSLIKLNKLERPSTCLFKDAMFKWRIPKRFSFVFGFL